MERGGIYDSDILVVDKSLKPCDGKIIVAAVNGELTVKRLSVEDGTTWLIAENEGYEPLEIKDGIDFHIWGVVTNVVHSV